MSVPSGPRAAINDPERFGRTYIHLTQQRCGDLIHVMTQQEPAIVDLVKDFCLADSTSNWQACLDIGIASFNDFTKNVLDTS